MSIRRGDVYTIYFPKSQGNVQQGYRPAVVISNDNGNVYSNNVIVLPMTTANKAYSATHAQIYFNGRLQTVLCENPQTINKEYLQKYMGCIEESDLRLIEEKIMISLSLTKEDKNMATVISVVNQKGGIGKTTTTFNLAAGLSRLGNNVLIIDCDPQGSLTIACGNEQPDELDNTLADIFAYVQKSQPVPEGYGIRQHPEGLDYIPANIFLSGTELQLVTEFGRELMLKTYIDTIRPDYDVILIDCPPSLGMLTCNALVASDRVIVPTHAEKLSIEGLELLNMTINRIKKLNPTLEISGYLVTMYQKRINMCRNNYNKLQEQRGSKVYEVVIPRSVDAPNSVERGISVHKYAPNAPLAMSYELFAKEVASKELESKSITHNKNMEYMKGDSYGSTRSV